MYDRDKFTQDGFCIADVVLEDDLLCAIESAISRIPMNVAHARESVYAIRNPLLLAPDLGEILRSSPLAALASSAFSCPPHVVRSVYFDKPVDANWRVPWHQDRMVALATRADVEHFTAWSLKDGIHHAQAPLALLEDMVTVRIHLDACDETNGALWVVPGSHRKGFLGAKEIVAMAQGDGETCCCLPRGGVMLMKPLLAHASNPCNPPRPRRVLHLELCNTPPHRDLQWQAAISVD